MSALLLRLAYLGITNALAMLRLLPMSDHDKDVEILALRHQITVLQRQMGTQRSRFEPSDRAFLAALLHRDGKFPPLFDAVLVDAGISVVLGGVRMPRMNAIMERRVLTCRRELLHALREFESFYNEHRPHQGISNARPLQSLPAPITNSSELTHLRIHRRDRLGGVLREYEHAA